VDERTFRDTDGVEVFYRRWMPSGDARLVVLVAHGMSEHSGRYTRLASILSDEGYAVYALDHRGHGRTAKATGVGRAGPRSTDGILDDIGALSEIARDEQGALPTVLFGHSMGSMFSLVYAERHGTELAGLVLSGSPGLDENVRTLAVMMRDAVDSGMGDEPVSALAPFNALFEPARTPFDWLSRDAAEVDAYLADPFCGDAHPMTYAFIADLIAMAADSMEAPAIAQLPKALPVLLLTGAADPVSGGGQGVRALEARLRAAGLVVDAMYYPDARHEVLNETNREEVHADIVEWIASIKS
jgi:alpha-beta hydrolase superfamily lysophospholipase